MASTKNKTVTEFLEGLIGSTHQGSIEDILQVTSLIRSAKDALTDDDFRDLRDRWIQAGKGGEKVWSKLLQIGLDDRLEAVKDHLPWTYTTLHQVHCLSDEELKAGIAEGHIHPKVSQGSLTRWIKHFRFEGSTKDMPEDFSSLVKVLAPTNLPEETLDRFRGDLEKLVGVYGFRTQYEAGETMVSLRQQRNEDKSEVMVGRLTKDLRSTWEGADDSLKTLFSLTSLDDLVLAPMSDFTGFLNRVRGGRDAFWSLHGTDYINKIALEYLRTSARAQRFNYRRRLKEVAEKQSQYADLVKKTLDEWMKY